MNFDIFDASGNFIGSAIEQGSGGGCIAGILAVILAVVVIVSPFYVWYMYFTDFDYFSSFERELFVWTLAVTGAIAVFFLSLTKVNSIHPLLQMVVLTWVPCTAILYAFHGTTDWAIPIFAPFLPSFLATLLSRLFIRKKARQKPAPH